MNQLIPNIGDFSSVMRKMRMFLFHEITQDVRDYAEKQGLAEAEALQKGMQVKSIEFLKQGGEVYKKV